MFAVGFCLFITAMVIIAVYAEKGWLDVWYFPKRQWFYIIPFWTGAVLMVTSVTIVFARWLP